MAGSSSSWYKVATGPLVGSRVFVPPDVQGILDRKAVQAQLEQGSGALFATVQAARQPGLRIEPPPWTPPGGVQEAWSVTALDALEETLSEAYQQGAGFATTAFIGDAPLQALDDYQSMAYVEINGFLWRSPDILSNPSAVAHAKKHIPQLDQLLNEARLPFNLVAVRVNSRDSALYGLAEALEVGSLYRSPAYDSASLYLRHRWGDSKVKVFYRLPQGAGDLPEPLERECGGPGL